MDKRKGFTLIELLVVIAIIALLIAILMPALQRAKKQALEVACQSKLHQWALIFSMYTNDNNGYFHDRPFGTEYEKMWPTLFQPYYSDPMLRCCPAAENPDRNRGPFGTWGWQGPADPEWGWGGSWMPEEGLFGSYGMSRYVLNKEGNEYWRRTDHKGSDKIPVFMDCMYVAVMPTAFDNPPDYDGQRLETDQMQYCCMGRHILNINGLFMDWSVRKIGLKELWTLRWSPTFTDEGLSPWTTAGGVVPTDWPGWMHNCKDY